MKKLFLTLFTATAMLPSLATTTYEIDGNNYTVDTLQHFKAGPGSIYTAIKFTGPSLTFRTFYLEVENNQKNFEIRTELGRDSIIGCENISDHAKRKTNENENYFAAVNGDFFATSGEVGTPVNGSIHNGIMGTMVTGSPHFVVAGPATPYVSNVSTTYNITIAGVKESLTGVNSKVGANSFILYTPAIGKFTHTPAGTTEVLLELADGQTWKSNAPMTFKVIGEASTTGNRLVDGKAVLSASGSYAAKIAGLKAGDEITAQFTHALTHYNSETPDVRQMLGGNTIFLKDGKRVEQGDFSRHPRTFVGYNKDRSKTIFAVVDGRSPISSGATYYELAGLMQWVGADWAINIDGGGSSSMFLPKFGAMNVPSDGHERAVANGIYCVSTAPQDETVAEIHFVEWAMQFPKYGIYTPKFYGYNKYGVLVDTDVKGVTLSCDSKIGEIINDGATFYGTGSGCGALVATLNGMTASIPVTVYESDKVKFRLENVLIDNVREYPIEVNSMVGENEMAISPSALAWVSDNSDIASVDANTGVLKGVKNGKATITGKVGSFTGNLNVTVEIPTADVMPVFQNFPTDAKIKQVGGTGIAMTEFENGFKLNYVGKSGRGQYIEINKEYPIWSLPEKLKIKINPGDTKISKITATAKNALGVMQSVWTATASDVPNNQFSEFEFNLTDWCDPEDIAVYPITLEKLRFTTSGSVANKEYEIIVSNFEAVYNYKQGGIEDINANTLKIYPNPVNSGESVNIEVAESTNLSVFSLSGTKLVDTVINGNCSFSTEGFAPGIYLVKLGTQTTKLIVK